MPLNTWFYCHYCRLVYIEAIKSYKINQQRFIRLYVRVVRVRVIYYKKELD